LAIKRDLLKEREKNFFFQNKNKKIDERRTPPRAKRSVYVNAIKKE
jgi:hypothetical protein